MIQIMLNDEQSQAVASAPHERVEVRDTDGKVVGYINPRWTKDDIAEAKHILATNKTWHTTEQVLAHLRSLETK